VALSLVPALLAGSAALAGEYKPRIIVMTDIVSETREPDDIQGVIHVLVYADMLEIEGLVATCGWNLSSNPETWRLTDLVNLYGQDLPNLRKRSGQTGHLSIDEERGKQEVGYWPSKDYLLERIKEGQPIGGKTRGMEGVGDGKDTPGSDLIISVVDEPDPRPVWIVIWGGPNTLMQALYKVSKTRSQAELDAFISKVRGFTAADEDDSGDDLRNTYPDLMYLWGDEYWRDYGQRWGTSYKQLIQGHGNLGRAFPDTKYGTSAADGTWLHFLPLGLTDPDHPDWGSWGGFMRYGKTKMDGTFCWSDRLQGDSQVSALMHETMDMWFDDIQADWAARMDWAEYGSANRNPQVVVNGVASSHPLEITVSPGSTVSLSAAGTSDPDGNGLSYKWYVYPEPGTYGKDVPVSNGTSQEASITIPADADGKTIHVVLEVADDGDPPLTSFRRVVLTGGNDRNGIDAAIRDRRGGSASDGGVRTLIKGYRER
jgi:hypothetical protein